MNNGNSYHAIATFLTNFLLLSAEEKPSVLTKLLIRVTASLILLIFSFSRNNLQQSSVPMMHYTFKKKQGCWRKTASNFIKYINWSAIEM